MSQFAAQPVKKLSVFNFIIYNIRKWILIISEKLYMFRRSYLKSSLCNCGLILKTSSFFPCPIKCPDGQNNTKNNSEAFYQTKFYYISNFYHLLTDMNGKYIYFPLK